MDRDHLRKKILDGDDRLMQSAAWRFMSDEEKRLIRAGRAFWAKSDMITNDALDDLLALYLKGESP